MDEKWEDALLEAGKLLGVEIAQLKAELSATRQEAEKWYSAFMDACRERDLLRKELAAKR